MWFKQNHHFFNSSNDENGDKKFVRNLSQKNSKQNSQKIFLEENLFSFFSLISQENRSIWQVCWISLPKKTNKVEENRHFGKSWINFFLWNFIIFFNRFRNFHNNFWEKKICRDRRMNDLWKKQWKSFSEKKLSNQKILDFF